MVENSAIPLQLVVTATGPEAEATPPETSESVTELGSAATVKTPTPPPCGFGPMPPTRLAWACVDRLPKHNSNKATVEREVVTSSSHARRNYSFDHDDSIRLLRCTAHQLARS
jgi:hypothetical protein